MSLYTITDFESSIKKNQRLIVRNGEFVGVYRYDTQSQAIYLTKPILDKQYGKRTMFNVKKEGEFWGCGGGNYESALIDANEAHLIPMYYDLRKKSHLQILDKCLGSCHEEVAKRIRNTEIAKINKKEICF